MKLSKILIVVISLVSLLATPLTSFSDEQTQGSIVIEESDTPTDTQPSVTPDTPTDTQQGVTPDTETAPQTPAPVEDQPAPAHPAK
jgi:hypothetical protein